MVFLHILRLIKSDFLFYTGQGLAVINNTRVFKKGLADIDGIILSHHHADHTGGLLKVLHETGPITVYTHPDSFKESYIRKVI